MSLKHFFVVTSRWGYRILEVGVLCVFMLALRQPPPPLPLPAQQTVQTAQPMTCIHTRLTDEAEPWKMAQSLVLVRELGATAIVEYFPWAYIEPAAGQYDWQHADQVVSLAQRQGLQVIARLGMVPGWARPSPDSTDTALATAHYVSFAHFVATFAARYAGQVQTLVLWNEPNLALEWGQQLPDALAYTELVRQAAMAARLANPAVRVLAGALAPTLEPLGSINGLNDLLFLEQALQAGLGQWVDGLAVHSYGMGQPPEQAPDPALLNFRRVELLQDLLVRSGYAALPLWITETGWNDSPRWAFASTPAERVRYTVQAAQWAVEHWQPQVKQLCFWVLRYPSPHQHYFDHYAFVSSDFTPLPVYTALQQWARGWVP